MELNMNGNFYGNNKPALHKSRSNAGFSQPAVAKSDVGDFQAGYFVMAEPMTQQQRLKTHRTPERNQRTKSENQFIHPRPHQQRERSAPKDLEQREGDMQVSQARLTSPNRSPNRNKRSPPHSSQAHVESHQSSSPHKPRKAYEKHTEKSDSFTSLESHSPPKGPSPPPTRWAGPAFNNAPPPSSLPLPDFPPFLASPSPSPQQSAQATIPIVYHPDPQFYIQPPLYAVPQFSVQFAYNQPPSIEAQLSMDLRKMLHISATAPQPIPA